MNPILICIIITFSISYIWDYVNFPNEFVSQIMSLILKRPVSITLEKPFGCSLCITTWTTLIILLCLDPSLCWLSLFFGMSTKYALYTIQITDKIISAVFINIERLLNKLR